MEWQKRFEVGHEKIDLEHHVFFDLVQSVARSVTEGTSRDKTRRLIAETVKYAEFHFLSEENIMIDIGYPDFQDHRRVHQLLLATLQHFIISFETGDSNIENLADFLTEWFIAHTTTEDLKITTYLNQKEIADGQHVQL